MSRHSFALSKIISAARKNWRPFLLGVSTVFLLAFLCILYLLDSARTERAAIFIGGTFAGMVGLAMLVCRR